MIEFMAVVIGIAFCIGIWRGMKTHQLKPQTKTSVGFVIRQTTIQPTLIDTSNKDIFNEAKSTLVSMGFTATEAKKMLKDVGPCTDVDEYVRKSLENIKI